MYSMSPYRSLMPACFSIECVPTGISLRGTGTVTRPGFVACLNCLWLPTCATSNHPSAFSFLMTSRLSTSAPLSIYLMIHTSYTLNQPLNWTGNPGLFRPRRHNAGHPRVGHQLAHVLVRMHNDAQIDTVHCCIAVFDVNLSRETLRRFLKMRLFHRIERPLEPADHVIFVRDRLLGVFFQIRRHLGAGYAE